MFFRLIDRWGAIDLVVPDLFFQLSHPLHLTLSLDHKKNSSWTSDVSRFRSWLSGIRFAGSGSSGACGAPAGDATPTDQTPPAPAPAAPTKPAAPIAAAKPAQGKLYAIDGNQILFAHGDNMLNSVQQALDDGHITADSARTILRNAKFPSKAKK